MPSSNLEELSQALSKIDRPGSFCVGGRAPAVLPGLEVEGVGPIGLPLNARMAKELIKHCERAPYGKCGETLVDADVRRVWRMKPDHFSLTNPDWKPFVAATVKKVQDELGLENQQLESHLYDLLLYEPGSFFLPHRDGEKLDRMVATLVVALPSSHEGGELVVRHDGQERTIDFSGDDSRFHIHYAAFYADCEHEVRPLRKGHRLCLIYNLTLAKSRKSIAAPRISEHIERINPLVREWAKEDSSGKLAITLDHQYTEDGLAWDTLKGADRVKAQVLLEAARQAGCRAYLALLTYHEEGEAEETYGGRGYGRHRWDDDRGASGHYKMAEVYETSLTAKGWIDGEGNGLPIGELNVEKAELLDPEGLTDVEPEEYFHGYTGNEGMPLERWYRHAAIFLWSEKRHFEMLCDRDGRKAVPVLNEMATRWRQSKGKAAAALKAQCIDLATAIVAKWPENRFTRIPSQESHAGAFLETLAALGEPGLIGDFLGNVLVKDASVDPGESVVTACRTHGWETFRQELLAVMKSTTIQTMERNVRLLEQIGSARPRKGEGWAELCAVLARGLVAAIQSIDREPSNYDYRSRDLNRAEVLAGLARSLIATEQSELLSLVVDHALASPGKYPLTQAHMAALVSLQPWLKKHVKNPSAALRRWLASCREQLEALTARAPREPADFRREAPITCKCADCAELKRFLEDPREPAHRFGVKEERRKHLEQQIRAHTCDLDLKTEKTRSPYTLACTKNKASYQEKLKKYHQDQEHLATARSIEASLPT